MNILRGLPPGIRPDSQPVNFEIHTNEQLAEMLARRFGMCIELSISKPNQWQARSHRTGQTTVYGHGDTITLAILDCAERAAKVEAALKGDSA